MTVGNYYTGSSITTSRINGAGTAPIYGQLATGTGAAAGVSAMNTPTNDARVAGTPSIVTTTLTNDTYQVVFTTTLGTGATVTQVALWDAAGTGTPATGGTMFFIAEFAGIVLAAGDSLTATCKTKFA